MRPEEFVYRCVDAGIRESAGFPRSKISLETFRTMAWGLRFYKMPVEFRAYGYDFEISLIEVNEVSNVSARMSSEHCVYDAMLTFSKINHHWFAHWVEQEGSDNDLVLLRVGTNYIEPCYERI